MWKEKDWTVDNVIQKDKRLDVFNKRQMEEYKGSWSTNNAKTEMAISCFVSKFKT